VKGREGGNTFGKPEARRNGAQLHLLDEAHAARERSAIRDHEGPKPGIGPQPLQPLKDPA
jgi:hypothetical protein